MKFEEYRSLDATALAQQVASGGIGPGELLELALARHHAVHGRINAVCRLMEAEARVRLQGPLRGPLAGVPFLIKDSSQDYAGLPTTEGSRALLRAVPERHSAFVRRLLEAGVVIFGKTNLPEFALKAVTDPVLFGVCRNPWNLDHTPGGSSGGAAAAVAAGIVPMASGSDGGGSIRIPAACCGLFGLRPSRGRISPGPSRCEVWNGASGEGVLSRSVRDTALALDILSGQEPGDPYVIVAPTEPYCQRLHRDPGRLRIGFSVESPLGTEVHPEAVAAVRNAVALLLSLGHEVEEAAPSVDGAALAASFLHLYFGQVAAAVKQARALGARSADFELITRVVEKLGKAVSAGEYAAHLAQWNDYARALGAFHQRYDMLLTPTLAHPPVRHGSGDPSRAESAALGFLLRTGLLGVLARLGLMDQETDRFSRANMRYVPFTQLANLTGTPAMSVPLHWCADGLPMGVQFVAAFGNEDRLLQLACQLESARPWFSRVPPEPTAAPAR